MLLGEILVLKSAALPIPVTKPREKETIAMHSNVLE